jgi:hypothetical protein
MMRPEGFRCHASGLHRSADRPGAIDVPRHVTFYLMFSVIWQIPALNYFMTPEDRPTEYRRCHQSFITVLEAISSFLDRTSPDQIVDHEVSTRPNGESLKLSLLTTGRCRTVLN